MTRKNTKKLHYKRPSVTSKKINFIVSTFSTGENLYGPMREPPRRGRY